VFDPTMLTGVPRPITADSFAATTAPPQHISRMHEVRHLGRQDLSHPRRRMRRRRMRRLQNVIGVAPARMLRPGHGGTLALRSVAWKPATVGTESAACAGRAPIFSRLAGSSNVALFTSVRTGSRRCCARRPFPPRQPGRRRSRSRSWTSTSPCRSGRGQRPLQADRPRLKRRSAAEESAHPEQESCVCEPEPQSARVPVELFESTESQPGRSVPRNGEGAGSALWMAS